MFVKKTLLLLLGLLLFSSCTNKQADFEFKSVSKSGGSLPEESIKIKCGRTKENCETLNYSIPGGFVYSWSQLFRDDEDVYVSLLREEDQHRPDGDEWCVFKNTDELFCATMYAGIDGPIVEMIKTSEGVLVRYLELRDDHEVEIKEKMTGAL